MRCTICKGDVSLIFWDFFPSSSEDNLAVFEDSDHGKFFFSDSLESVLMSTIKNGKGILPEPARTAKTIQFSLPENFLKKTEHRDDFKQTIDLGFAIEDTEQ